MERRRKREQFSLLQGIAAIWHFLQEQYLQANAQRSGTSPAPLPFAAQGLLFMGLIYQRWALYCWVADSQGRRFNLYRGKGWSDKRRILGEWFHHHAAPNNLAVCYYYHTSLSRLTLTWTLRKSCVSGHLERRMFGSWAPAMLGAQEHAASHWTI